MVRLSRLEIDHTEIVDFQECILSWYDAFKRDLPWRGDPDPYHILVSEVMLQQTGVARVTPKYYEFLDRFPTLAALAAASIGDVLRTWQGLGYNRRALNLKRVAESAVERFGGELPGTVEDLETLPGIGKYTARAIASFAFGVQVPVVDTNVRRVLSDWIGRGLTDRQTWDVAQRVLPLHRTSDWNQALMDYGAAVKKASPKRTGKASEPFATSNRFWRGRIVDALRDRGNIPMAVLLDALPYAHRDDDRVRELVRVLHEEGLIEYRETDDAVSLPD